MNPDRESILTELQRGQEALHRSLEGIDEARAALRPAQGRWSVLECVDHVAVVEEYLYSRLAHATRAEQPLHSAAREKRIRIRANDRSRPIQAPGVALPQGRYASVADALAAFGTARARTERWVCDVNDDYRHWVTDHPLIPGPVNCFEMLLMIAAHPARHAGQIEEIRVLSA